MFEFILQRFANEGFSDANDLMVGAGTLFFNRIGEDGKYVGWHHLGNVEEFNITTDVTTIEKNSSMNKRRELMASVVTAVNPTASLTLNEYDPDNISLGLFGVVGTEDQAGSTHTETYTLRTVPGMFHLTIDPDEDDGVFNIQNVSINGTAAAPHISAGNIPNVAGQTIDMLYADVQVSGASGSMRDGDSITVTVADTTGGNPTDLSSLTVTINGTTQTLTGTSDTVTLANGVVFSFNFNATQSTGSPTETFDCHVPSGLFQEGVDYTLDPYLLRGGVIQVPESSSLVAGQSYTITYTTKKETFTVINGAGSSDIQGMLKFIGDPNLGVQYIIEAWNVKITPDGDLTGLISDDFGSYNLSVKFLADYKKHPKYPYYKVTKVGKTNQGDVADHPYRKL